MNKALEKLKKLVSMQEISAKERKEIFEKSLVNLDTHDMQLKYMKEELDKLRGRTM